MLISITETVTSAFLQTSGITVVDGSNRRAEEATVTVRKDVDAFHANEKVALSSRVSPSMMVIHVGTTSYLALVTDTVTDLDTVTSLTFRTFRAGLSFGNVVRCGT